MENKPIQGIVGITRGFRRFFANGYYYLYLGGDIFIQESRLIKIEKSEE